MRKLIVTSPRLTLAVLAAIVLVIGHRAVFITLDNSPETFFAADDESREVYEDFEQIFGADEVVLVDLRGASHQRASDLLRLAELTRALESLPGVSSAVSISKVFDDGAGDLPAALDEATVASVEREVSEVGVYRDLGLVRPEAPAMAVMTTLEVERSDPASRTAIVEQIDAVVEEHRREGGEVLVAGLAPTHAAFDRLTRRSLLLFMPLVVLVSLLIGFALFRSVGALLATFAPVLAGVALGVAALQLAGQSLNLVTAVLPPLVMAIGFASAIHIVTHYGNVLKRGLTPSEAALQALREKRWPTAFGILTTAIGFGSLALSPVTSVQVLGVSSALTLVVTLALVLIGTPALLALLRPKLHAPPHRRQMLERLAVAALHHRPLTLVVVGVVAGAVILGSTQLRSSINGVQMLDRDSPERIAYETLEREGLGLANLEVWLKLRTSRPEDLRAEHERLRRLSKAIEEIPGVTGTFSAADLLDLAEYRQADARERGLSRREALAELGGNGEHLALLSRMWSPSSGLRITTLAHTADRAEEIDRQRRAVRAAVSEVYPDTAVEITGHYPLLIGTPNALMETLFSSLSVTIAIVFALFLIAFRSLGLVLAGMTANLLPVAAVLGAMGWFGVSLDVATIMTGSVVFGLAVDDTFHYLYHRKESGSLRQAAGIAGQGIVATTAVVTLGFASLGLSGFLPVLSFGLLTAFGALSALGIDALLLPALLGDESEKEHHTSTSSYAVVEGPPL